MSLEFAASTGGRIVSFTRFDLIFCMWQLGANYRIWATMASDEADRVMSLLDEWGAEKALLLKPKSWRVFVDSASSERVEVTSIEFVCKWRPSLADDPIHVGKLREELDEIPITLTIHRAHDSLINALRADNASRKEAEPADSHKMTEFSGLMKYWEPVNSGDGVVADKHGSVSGWFSLGPNCFDFIRSIITQSETPKFSIGLTIRLPTKGRNWDGEGQIDIVSGRIVFSSTDKDSDADSEPQEFAPDPAALAQAASKELAMGLQRLRTTMIWAAGAIAIAVAIFR